MNIEYRDIKDISAKDIEDLFLSVNWLSGKYPERLVKAFKASSFVFTAWDGDKLVGLIRALDDGEMVAYVHYLLVHPDYQGLGISSKFITTIKERYKDYLYINLMPDEKKNVSLYAKHGFVILEEGTAMQMKNAR